MKSSFALKLGAAALSAGLLAGCGQPGPLYLPKPPAKPAVPTPPSPPPTPVQ